LGFLLVFYTKYPELPFCVLEKDGHILESSQNSCDPEAPEPFSNSRDYHARDSNLESGTINGGRSNSYNKNSVTFFNEQGFKYYSKTKTSCLRNVTSEQVYLLTLVKN